MTQHSSQNESLKHVKIYNIPPTYMNIHVKRTYQSSNYSLNKCLYSKPSRLHYFHLTCACVQVSGEFTMPSGRVMDTLWKKLPREVGKIKIDTDKLEHLFESRTLELKPKVGLQSLWPFHNRNILWTPLLNQLQVLFTGKYYFIVPTYM